MRRLGQGRGKEAGRGQGRHAWKGEGACEAVGGVDQGVLQCELQRDRSRDDLCGGTVGRLPQGPQTFPGAWGLQERAAHRGLSRLGRRSAPHGRERARQPRTPRDRVLRGETGRPTSPLQAVCGEGAPGRRFLRAHRLRLTVKPPSPRKCAAPCPCIWGHHHPLFVPTSPLPSISVQSQTVPGQGSSLVGAWKECKSGQVNKI